MPKHRVKLLQCPNCNTPLPDAENYCPNCGQENHEIIRPISHLWKELLGNLFNIDSRFFHTIKALFLSPGKLTQEYNAGKRQYYLTPVRVYLIASVLFFFMQSISMKLSDEQLQEIESAFDKNPADTMHLNLLNETLVVTNEEMLSLSRFNAEKLDSFLIQHNMEPTFFNRIVIRQSSKAMDGNLNTVSSTFQHYMSFAMFVFMPLMGLLLMLFYHRQKRFYVEHLIFSVHFHTTAFFIMSGVTLIGFLPLKMMSIASFLLYILLLLYLLLPLKKVYQQSWKKTIFKLITLLISYGFLVMVGIVAIMVLTLFIF